MKENYAEVLESYIIPAEEGFVGGALKALGFTVKAIFLFPFVLIGGAMIVSGIYVANEARRLRKLVKKNKGKYANYGSASNQILKTYSKDISGVQEPKSLNTFMPYYQKVLSVTKEADAIRKEFNRYNPFDSNFAARCKKILDKLEALEKKVNAIPTISDNDISKLKTDEMNTSPLASSTVMKLSNIENEIWDLIYHGYGYDEEDHFVEDIVFDNNDQDFYDELQKHHEYYECANVFSDIINRIMYYHVDTIKFIEICKFAVNHKAKPKK